MSVTDVQHVYIRHAHTCIRPASGVLTEDMLTPAACMIIPELNMLTSGGYMIMPEPNMPTPAAYMTKPDRNMLTPA